MSDQPRVSIVLLAYKQENFIRAAVQSALAQTYGNLEIVLSDDASADGTFGIMKEEADRYSGPHKLILNRNPTNLGLTGNLNRAAALASGDLLVEQDGDDISLPVRTSRLVQRWLDTTPKCSLVFSDATRIAADGSVLPRQLNPLPIVTLEEFVKGAFFIAGGCVSAYSRLLFSNFGPLDPAIRYPDYVLTFRALLASGCAFVDEPLVRYRVHEASITQRESNTRESPRRDAARWARDEVATAQECLRNYDLSRRRGPVLRWRLARAIAQAQLDERSSNGSHLELRRSGRRNRQVQYGRQAFSARCFSPQMSVTAVSALTSPTPRAGSNVGQLLDEDLLGPSELEQRPCVSSVCLAVLRSIR